MESLVEEAATYEKCLEKIHGKYGPNILISRVETGKANGLLGFLGKDIIRLIFTIQNKPFVPQSKENDNEIGESVFAAERTRQAKPFIPPNEKTARRDILQHAASQSGEIAKKITPFLSQTPQQTESGFSAQNEDLRRLADTVKKLAEQINEKRGFSSEHENIKKISQILEDNDFTNRYIYSMCEKINSELRLNELDDFETLQKKVIGWIADSIPIRTEKNNGKGKIISLIGSTGIGKTTTLIKIAAYYIKSVSKKIEKKLNVRIITFDRYRIGAEVQIQKYCEIMKIPLAIADSPADLRKYLSLYKNEADVICIDTTGRSPNDAENILKMQTYFDVIDKETAEIHLAVSAVTKTADIREIIKQYAGFKYSNLIITKIDETSNTGGIISILSEYNIPASYVTTGQKVPNDIEKASKFVFLKKLKGFNLENGYYRYIEENFNDEIPIMWK